MIPVAEAVTRVLAGIRPLAAELVPLRAGLGRVLANEVRARRTQPPAALSAMDGYAVRAADVAQVPAVLRQVGYVPAGSAHERPIGPGECVRIFTGAPIPAGADAIVIQEDASAAADRVTVRETVAPGRYVRPAGMDFAAGEVGIEAGRVLNARDLGIAAAMNVPWLMVRRRPRVAILATGDEIVLPGDTVGPNQIVSSNAATLGAFVSVLGGEPLDLGIARDRQDQIVERIEAARGADLLLTTGGASVGEHDLVQQALKKLGLSLDFWQIAMRPGKPLMSGRIGDLPVLGLPGNPVSAMVCALLFVRPVLRALLGLVQDTERENALLGADLGGNDRREDYLRATLTLDAADRPIVTPFKVQDSSNFLRLVRADCLLIRPPHAPPAKAGEAVPILRFPAGLTGV
jgi:molybdopterin molybdotransferase